MADLLLPAAAIVPSAHASSAAWLAPRLADDGTVASVVPDGFPAYARVLHPASDEDEEPASWADVAQTTGRPAHALMLWEEISTVVRAGRTRPGWDGEEPDPGNLDPDTLEALLGVLASHTTTPHECWYGLWDGWGTAWDAGAPTWGEQAEVGLGGRVYRLFAGPLSRVPAMGHQMGPSFFVHRSPNLVWPQDLAWCAGTDPDLDSTLVAGSDDLVEDLLADPALEVWQVEPGDSLRP